MFIADSWKSFPYIIQSDSLPQSICQCFFLLWHSLSDLGVSDLLVDGSRLNLLQRTHDTELLAPVGLNQGVHPVRVKHDVVGCDQQHPAHRALNQHGEKEEWVNNNGIQPNFLIPKKVQLRVFICHQNIIKSTSAT